MYGPQARATSPVGGSTLITSAPRSASSIVQNGPDSTWVRSTTRSPASGPVTAPPRRSVDTRSTTPNVAGDRDHVTGWTGLDDLVTVRRNCQHWRWQTGQQGSG